MIETKMIDIIPLAQTDFTPETVKWHPRKRSTQMQCLLHSSQFSSNNFKHLPWGYNKWFYWEMLDVSGDEIY